MPERWENWAGEQVCAPLRIERPRDEDELRAAVSRAAEERRNVKAFGSGHSFTDCACTDGVLIDTSRLSGVIDADPESGLVTVAAGTKLHALGPMLAERGLGLQNQGDIDAQSVAGATATATHGTGVSFTNLSAQIEGVRLVTASGETLDLDRGSDSDAFLAARVSIGALGIVSRVTVRCVPLYTLHRRDEPLPIAETLERLDEHVDSNDHFEFFHFPYTTTALCRFTRRSKEPPDPTPAWKRKLNEEILENRALAVITRAGRAMPRTVPRLNRLIAAAMSGGEVTDRAYRVYATTRAVRFTEMEYAIPRESCREAVERILALIESRRLPIAFPLEIRFAAGDDSLLSTAHGRETAYIAIHQTRGMEFETFFRGAEEIFDSYGGRPHWGKRHYQSATELCGRYPEWNRFQAVRERLDPDRVFENAYTRRVLG